MDDMNEKELQDMRLWDPDYTKLTPAEKANLDEALADKERVSHDEIDWD